MFGTLRLLRIVTRIFVARLQYLKLQRELIRWSNVHHVLYKMYR
jgi:hypothetical protein